MLDISIILPTRERPHLVSRLFQSIADTAMDLGSLEVVLYLDEDDQKSKDISDGRLEIQRLIRPRAATMGAILRDSAAAARGRYLFLMNDDAIFRTRGWDRAVKEAFARFPDDIALVYGNDLDRGRSAPTFPLISRAACEALGEICPSGYRNLYIDFHLLDIFEELARLGHQRIVYLEDVVFEHMHHAIGKAPLDATYTKKDARADDYLFFALSESRKASARKLAGVIERAREHEAPSSRTPVATIVVRAAAGRVERTLDLLRHLKAQPQPTAAFEVLALLEKECPAAAEKLLRLSFPGLETLRSKEPARLASVMEEAARAARGEFLVHLDPMARSLSGWLDALVAAARSAPDAGAVGALLLSPRNGNVVHAGMAFFLRDDGSGLAATCLYRGFPADHPAVLKARELQAVSPACVLLRKKTILECEERRLSFDARAGPALWLDLKRNGWKIVYCPQAKLLWEEESGPFEGQEEEKRRASRGAELSLATAGYIPHADLEEILAEDGFCLRREDGQLRVMPRPDGKASSQSD